MRILTSREFYHSPALTRSLPPGEFVIVADNGQPAFMVTKAITRPRKTRKDLEREAREVCTRARPKVNFTAALKHLESA